MEPIIRIEKLNFVYNKGKDNQYHALVNVNLEVFEEEFVIIFGPSGCGKSTLLNVIAGLEIPDSGSVEVFSKDLMKMSKKESTEHHRTQIGMIFQSYNLISSLTVLDNISLPQMFLDISKRKREEKAHMLLERFDVVAQAKKVPTELSGGQQQRIGIARAIINNPKIVLADEPVGNLDSISAKNVFDILKDLIIKEKRTVLLVTHNPEYLDYGDRIISMRDGRITKEVISKLKFKRDVGTQFVPKPPSTEISELMRAYHGLSPEQINILIMPYKARIFAHHFITDRTMEETRIFEDIMQRRLLGTVSQDELMDILDRPAHEGGIGFDKRTAEKIMRRINRAIRMAYFINQKIRQKKDEKGQHIIINENKKAEKLTNYLLKTVYYKYYRNLSESQFETIKYAVKDRLLGKIQKSDFNNVLDKPARDGGVGLNIKTAKAITEQMELIIVLGFGMIFKKKAEAIIKKQVLEDEEIAEEKNIEEK